MLNVKISDSNQLVKFACEDLMALQSVILTVEDHPEYCNAHEMLIVTRKALEPVIAELREAIKKVDEELEKMQEEE